MADRYGSFSELTASGSEGIDFRRTVRYVSAAWLVLAPHGGGIEPGTSEIARAIAGEELSLYLFEGIRRSGNVSLHLTSTNFNDPQVLQLLHRSHHTLAIHGSDTRQPLVSIGGLDMESGEQIRFALSAVGVCAVPETGPSHPGTHVGNICNRNASGKGVQLEFSRGLRTAMFEGLTRSQRTHPTDLFATVVRAVRTVLLAPPGDAV
jgi:phage replication-related protein YjqB (UPF0714/DUF867 family)